MMQSSKLFGDIRRNTLCELLVLNSALRPTSTLLRGGVEYSRKNCEAVERLRAWGNASCPGAAAVASCLKRHLMPVSLRGPMNRLVGLLTKRRLARYQNMSPRKHVSELSE